MELDDARRAVIERIHASGYQIALVVTGGGSGAISGLLRVPGGSRSILDAAVPYHQRALSKGLGFESEHACSEETALALARVAWNRAESLADCGRPRIGVGATASLVSDRPKKGDHRCHIAVASDASSFVVSITLERGRRDRRQEEDLVAWSIVCCIAEACGVEASGAALGEHDRLTRRVANGSDWIGRLLRGESDRITIMPDGRVAPSSDAPAAVLAGSFDPLHDAHLELARVAAQLLGARVSYEISVVNVDKPPLSVDAVRRRLEQFAWRSSVELTRAATFAEKARLLPGTTFVVGADTAERIVAPKYYGGDPLKLLQALNAIASSGCRFLVAARADASGRVLTLADLEVPPGFGQIFEQIPPQLFRHDLSSSDIRSRQEKQRLK